MDKRHDFSRLFWLIFVIATVASAVIGKYTLEISNIELIKPYVIVFLFLALVETTLKGRFHEILEEKASFLLLAFGYTLAVILISLFPVIPVYVLWMVGPVLIGSLLHPIIGICFQLVLTFLFCMLNGHNLEFFIYYFLIGGTMCFLGKYVVSLMSLIYIGITTMSIHVILIFLMKNLALEEVLKPESLFPVLISGGMMFILYLLPKTWKDQVAHQADSSLNSSANRNWSADHVYKMAENMENATLLVAETDQPNDSGVDAEGFKETEVDYDIYVGGEAPLLKRLKEEMPAVYRHSLLISLLSEKAAHFIECNGTLAKAGGLYHEIGKLSHGTSSGNYIEQGVLLGQEAKLPEAILDIIREHSGKQGVPTSKEAAIVMLTDNIIATIKYFEKESDKKAPNHDKIIENIFDVRLGQGVLDETGLTLNEYKRLKSFYHENIPKGNK